ncbi:MAG: hypothetical protein V3R64_04270 [Sphingomonadales bacterium]
MLKTPLKLLVAAAIALPAGLAFSDANAGSKRNKHHNSYKYSGGYSAGGHHGYGYNNRGRHYGYGYSSHHYKPYYGGGYYYGGHRNRHHGHGNVGAYAGLALLGLGLGYAISKSSKNDYRRDEYDDRRYQNERRYYSPPPSSGQYEQDYEGEYQEPQAYRSGASSFDFSQCTETREYQTSIFVDGQEQQAFGTACLMPDGSWVAGPMNIQ